MSDNNASNDVFIGYGLAGGFSQDANNKAAIAAQEAQDADHRAAMAQNALSREQDRSTSTLAATVGVVGALVHVRQELAEEKKKTADILARVSEMISTGALNLLEKNKLLCRNYEESQLFVLQNTVTELKTDSLAYQNIAKALCKKHGVGEVAFNKALLLERNRLGTLPFAGTQYLNLDEPSDFIARTSKNEYINTERADIEKYYPSYQRQLSSILRKPEMYIRASGDDELLAPIVVIENSHMTQYKTLLEELEKESVDPQVRVQQYEVMIQCVSDAIATEDNPRMCVELQRSKFRHAQVDFLGKYAVELKKDVRALRQTLTATFMSKGETAETIMAVAVQERAKFADFTTGFGIKFDRAGDFLQRSPRIEELEGMMQVSFAIGDKSMVFQASRDAYYEQRRIREAEAANGKMVEPVVPVRKPIAEAAEKSALSEYDMLLAKLRKSTQPSAEAAEKPALCEYDMLLAKHQAGYK